ncbi:MAG: VanW family protein [Patescibacteria group bacterium]|nr:VanW family protein [Patescibacteria group bacterium]
MKINLGEIQNNKKKLAFKRSFIFTLIFVLIISGAYYLFVNVFYKNKVLPGVTILGVSAFGLENDELSGFVNEKIIPTIPQKIDFSVDGYSFTVPTSELDISIDPANLLEYGKGASLLKLYTDGLKLLDKENLTPTYIINIDPILQGLPITKNTKYAAQVRDGRVLNCMNANYFISIDEERLSELTIQAIDNRTGVQTTFVEIALNPDEAKIVSFCRKYLEDGAVINISLRSPFGDDAVLDQFFGLYTEGEGLNWKILNSEKLKNELQKLKARESSPPYDDDYVVWGDKVLLFKSFEKAGGLKISDTMKQIEEWLKLPNSDLPIVYKSLDKTNLDKNLEVLDFTQLLSAGKTRMPIYENGEKNLKLANAQGAIEELHHTIILQGDKVSFLEEMDVRPGGMTGNWRSYGGGVCNASTTAFRAVLEGGFPIVEWHSHSFYVESYNWGEYKYNIVQAAVTTDPKLDFVFENDLPYPILLRTNIYQKGDYQYHTIFIMTSSEYSDDRKVELSDWKKWNERSDKRFFGSFDRKVWEENELIREETFVSEYVETV